MIQNYTLWNYCIIKIQIMLYNLFLRWNSSCFCLFTERVVEKPVVTTAVCLFTSSHHPLAVCWKGRSGDLSKHLFEWVFAQSAFTFRWRERVVCVCVWVYVGWRTVKGKAWHGDYLSFPTSTWNNSHQRPHDVMNIGSAAQEPGDKVWHRAGLALPLSSVPLSLLVSSFESTQR